MKIKAIPSMCYVTRNHLEIAVEEYVLLQLELQLIIMLGEKKKLCELENRTHLF